MEKQTKQQFTIQMGAINITTYQQEDESETKMLARALTTYKKVKDIDEEKKLGLLAYKPYDKRPAKTSWKIGDPSPKCPKCDAEMRERQGSRGPFWGCTKYPECNGIVNISSGFGPATLKLTEKPMGDDELNATIKEMSA